MRKIETMRALLKVAKGVSKKELSEILDGDISYGLYRKIDGEEHKDKVDIVYKKARAKQ